MRTTFWILRIRVCLQTSIEIFGSERVKNSNAEQVALNLAILQAKCCPVERNNKDRPCSATWKCENAIKVATVELSFDQAIIQATLFRESTACVSHEGFDRLPRCFATINSAVSSRSVTSHVPADLNLDRALFPSRCLSVSIDYSREYSAEILPASFLATSKHERHHNLAGRSSWKVIQIEPELT